MLSMRVAERALLNNTRFFPALYQKEEPHAFI